VKNSKAILVSLLLLSVAVPACRKEASSKEEAMGSDVVATVGGRSIRTATLEKELRRRGPGATKEEVLAELLRFESALAQARAAGFDREPGIVSEVEHLIVSRFEERELAGAESAPVTDADVQARYEAESSRHAAEADDAGFDRLVRENSEDTATRFRRGDTGWVSERDPGGWDPALVAALFALNAPGDCTPPVKTGQGFAIARLFAVRAAARRPLSEVAEAIRYRLRLEARERVAAEFQARMRTGLEIRTNRQALDRIIATDRQTQPPPHLP
jgi:parvulin-like peptidyl-prolyl isomerase